VPTTCGNDLGRGTHVSASRDPPRTPGKGMDESEEGVADLRNTRAAHIGIDDADTFKSRYRMTSCSLRVAATVLRIASMTNSGSSF
jgi:hypothetical protein